MTGYHISIGYLSGGDKDEAWATLKEVVAKLCAEPAAVAMEALKYGMPPDRVREYAEPYRSFSAATGRTEDSTLVIKEADPDDPESYHQVMQLAGGGGESRGLKEATRRAFCRLVLKEMHKREYEININVS